MFNYAFSQSINANNLHIIVIEYANKIVHRQKRLSFSTAIDGHKGLQKGGFALNTLISFASLAQIDRYPTDNPVVINHVEVRTKSIWWFG